MMKRSREDGDHQVEALAMANCLMLLSRVGKSAALPASRVFTCKTCNREFSSFQALGGHRASHKKPFRLMSGDHLHVQTPSSPPKPKTHECSICGLNFTIGQALGGHMRRHRSYIFFPSTAMNLSLILYLPELDRKISCEYKDSPEPIRIPGCTPLHGSDLLDPLQDRKDEAYKWVLHHGKRYRMAEGIMVNSFKDLEPGAIKYLQEPKPGKPPVYPIGPLIQMGPIGGRVEGSECLRWLDEQPRGSVLFISFGSGGTLSFDQLHQLALGLEMSGQRFLWVVRSPNDKVANASFFSAHSQNDPFAFLPNGFIDRTKEHGLVVPNWAPQPQVLSHGSTGGFLSHCGWNSTLESVVNGVPLITWPLYAEQKMNAVILAEDLKVALRPRAGENGLIGSAEIARVVKGLLQGEESKQIRSRMRDLKEAAGMMLSRDGESTKLLTELAQKWRNELA